MSLRRSYHFLIGCFAILFVALQGAALAHAAQYNDNVHEHNGVVCAVDAIAAEQNAIVPLSPVTDIPVLPLEVSFVEVFVTAVILTPPGRAPPPRSPPATL